MRLYTLYRSGRLSLRHQAFYQPCGSPRQSLRQHLSERIDPYSFLFTSSSSNSFSATCRFGSLSSSPASGRLPVLHLRWTAQPHPAIEYEVGRIRFASNRRPVHVSLSAPCSSGAIDPSAIPRPILDCSLSSHRTSISSVCQRLFGSRAAGGRLRSRDSSRVSPYRWIVPVSPTPLAPCPALC